MAKIFTISNEEDKQNIVNFLMTNQYPTDASIQLKQSIKRKAKSLHLIESCLYIKEQDVFKHYICKHEDVLITKILNNYHLPGHIGFNELNDSIKQNYIGISINSIKHYINNCIGCKRETITAHRAPISPVIPSFIRERLLGDMIDLSEYASFNDGTRYLFTFIDSFSKFAFVYPSEGKDLNDVLIILKHLFYRGGSWKKFYLDKAGELVDHEIKTFLKFFNIENRQGAPYRPQIQGQIKRFNMTLKSRIRKATGLEGYRYIEILPAIVFQYNATKHRTTGISPFVLFKGHDPYDRNGAI